MALIGQALMEPPWARMGWACVALGPCGPGFEGAPGPLWAVPLWGPWALVGQVRKSPPWALAGQAFLGPEPLWAGPLSAPLGANGPGPCGLSPWAPLGLMGQPLMSAHGPSWAGP